MKTSIQRSPNRPYVNKVIAIALLIGLSSSLLARARLGETPAQCAQRYGQPIRSSRLPGNSMFYPGVELRYRFQGLDIQVWFVDDRAVHLHVQGPYRIFAEGKVGRLLSLSAQGHTWTVPFVVSDYFEVDERREGPFEWSRSDGGWAKHTVVRGVSDNVIYSCLGIYSADALRPQERQEKLALYQSRMQTENETGDVSGF